MEGRGLSSRSPPGWAAGLHAVRPGTHGLCQPNVLSPPSLQLSLSAWGAGCCPHQESAASASSPLPLGSTCAPPLGPEAHWELRFPNLWEDPSTSMQPGLQANAGPSTQGCNPALERPCKHHCVQPSFATTHTLDLRVKGWLCDKEGSMGTTPRQQQHHTGLPGITATSHVFRGLGNSARRGVPTALRASSPCGSCIT